MKNENNIGKALVSFLENEKEINNVDNNVDLNKKIKSDNSIIERVDKIIIVGDNKNRILLKD
jgi:hypothetical protein